MLLFINLSHTGNREIPHFALPGNPSANMISFEILVRPAILKMMGKSALSPEIIDAIIEDPVNNPKPGRRFIWVSIERRNGIHYARLTSSQTSGALNSISLANGLVIIPEEIRSVKEGDKVRVIRLDWH